MSTQIIAKKISIKFFDDPAQHDLKLKYYNLMISLDRDTSYLKTSRHYQAISEPLHEASEASTKSEQAMGTEDKDKKKKSSTEPVTASAGSTSGSSSSPSSKKKGKDSDKNGKKSVEFALPSVSPKQVEQTPEEIAELKNKLICAVLYCVLAPYDNEQSDMMAHLSKNKKLEEIPVYK